MTSVETCPPGSVVFERQVGPVTMTDIVRFAGAGGDFNPLHHDESAARAAGFDKPIAMGHFTVAALAGALTDWCGVEHLQSLRVSFRAPVHAGDTVSLSGHVESSRPLEDGFDLTSVLVQAHVGADLVVDGVADVVTRE